jgi:hypothetical protein
VHPIILAVVLIPVGVAGLVWLGVAWLLWDSWSGAVAGFITGHSWGWTADWDTAWLITLATWFGAMLVLGPLILLTAVLIASIFAMPVLVNHVARDAFPGLERRKGGTLAGSLWNALAAVATFLLLWILSLPLWLLGPLGIVVPLLLSAHLNQRLFRYDALSEHASAEEIVAVVARARGRLFLLGLATGALYFIPLFNLVGPVFAALAFIHLCLAELQSLRASRGVSPGTGTRGEAGARD